MSREIHGQGAGIQAGYAQGPEVRGTHGQGAGIQDAHAQGTVGQGRREQGQTSREDRDKPVYSAEQVNRLSQDEGFSQLLYIAQKYLNKVFTPRDCQVFAYLYEDLGMNEEVLEYLVEYCVQNGHTSMRYIEAVARSWHEKGIRTAQEAKDYSASYNRDSFAVMKAFGINSRKPAAPEQKLMDKWFKDYGFSRDVVLEACNRTITAIHNPSFQYADKILTDWKEAGVRGLGDIMELDARRMAAKEDTARSRDKRLQTYDTAVSGQGDRTRKGAPNQFHNFEQRDTDYDALMLKQVKEWVGQQP
jgi:DnaD/phage-associated family protein